MLKKTTELFQPTKGVDHTTGIRSTSGRVYCFVLQEFSKVGLFVAPVKTLKLSIVILERPQIDLTTLIGIYSVVQLSVQKSKKIYLLDN